MKHYVIATQQPWGRKVFREAMGRLNEAWIRAEDTATLCRSMQGERPRYAFFVNWSAIISPDILCLTECVNFHAFGPRQDPMVWHRGGGPIENLILRGYTETLIWAHRMTDEVDAGPVYGSRGPVSFVRYIAKPDTWFDAGAEARRIAGVTEGSGLYEGIRDGKPDEETCLDSEFDVRPCTKAEILDRFVNPVASLIREIVETEPAPMPQVGEVVHIKRLPMAEYEKFWEERT